MISSERRRDVFGLRPSAKRYLLLALVLPAIVISAVYGSLWISGLAPLRFTAGFSLLGRLAYEWTIGFGLAFIAALVEELLFRGFVVSWLVRRFGPVAGLADR
jgi:membrane protease YdiL (CAAX protease family)